MSGFVYIWRDSKRGKFYIGSHWGDVTDRYVCGSIRMLAAYRKRPDTFKRRVLAIILTNRRDLHHEEQRWLAMVKDHELCDRYYNLKKQAVGADPAVMKVAMLRNKNGLGKPCSPEKARKIALAQIGKVNSLQARQKMRIAKLGKTQSPEHVEKRIQKLRGRKRNPLVCQKISASKMGHIVTTETRAKISASKRGQTL